MKVIPPLQGLERAFNCLACATRLFSFGNIVRLDFDPTEGIFNDADGVTLVQDEDDDDGPPPETRRPFELAQSSKRPSLGTSGSNQAGRGSLTASTSSSVSVDESGPSEGSLTAHSTRSMDVLDSSNGSSPGSGTGTGLDMSSSSTINGSSSLCLTSSGSSAASLGGSLVRRPSDPSPGLPKGPSSTGLCVSTRSSARVFRFENGAGGVPSPRLTRGNTGKAGAVVSPGPPTGGPVRASSLREVVLTPKTGGGAY
jgi:hypothetical protein